MDSQHVQGDLPAYALDILDAADRARIERHLAGCGACQTELTELGRSVQELAWIAAEAEPDPELRQQILAGVARRPPRPVERWAWLRPILAAAAALIIFAFGYGTAVWLPRLSGPRAGSELVDLFNPARMQVAVLQPTEYAPGATARVYFEPDRKDLVLAIDSLPPPPPGQVYQLWANAGSRRLSAGTFVGDQRVYRFVCPREMGLYDSVGVTIEPAGGRTEPSGPRVLFGALPKT